METHYDFIILGTGLTECILGSILSMKGKSILQIDRNNYYGGECTSFNLSQLIELFSKDDLSENEFCSESKKYNIDLIPKFIMSEGKLTDILSITKVTSYLEFEIIKGSYVYRNGRVAKVPSKKIETLKSSLISFFEKKRVWDFFNLVRKHDKKELTEIDLEQITANGLYDMFGLEKKTREVIGHAIALFPNEEYLNNSAIHLVNRIALYIHSISRFGNSPYIYPKYGLGELPQAFARLGAVNGGTYILEKEIDRLCRDENGFINGVFIDSSFISCSFMIGSPLYFGDVCFSMEKITRAICILNHPIPNTAETDSAQIIIPQGQLNRKNDIYIAILSHKHKICPKGKWIAIISTVVETTSPEKELEPAFSILGEIERKFVSITEIKVPDKTKQEKNLFISKTMDPSSHFETVYEDVERLYKEITGETLDMFLEKMRKRSSNN